MNKADTTTAKEKALTERSPYLWHTVPALSLNTEDGAENPFLPKGWVADSEDDVVCANFSVEGLIPYYSGYRPVIPIKGPVFTLSWHLLL